MWRRDDQFYEAKLDREKEIDIQIKKYRDRRDYEISQLRLFYGKKVHKLVEERRRVHVSYLNYLARKKARLEKEKQLRESQKDEIADLAEQLLEANDRKKSKLDDIFNLLADMDEETLAEIEEEVNDELTDIADTDLLSDDDEVESIDVMSDTDDTNVMSDVNDIDVSDKKDATSKTNVSTFDKQSNVVSKANTEKSQIDKLQHNSAPDGE